MPWVYARSGVVSGVLVAVAAAVGPARAHPAPPFVTGVAAVDSEGPRVVKVTEGLVQRRDGRWIFVCPVLFGDDPEPPALSVDGSRTFVPGKADLMSLEPDGTVTPQGKPKLSRGSVTRLLESRGVLYASILDASGTSLVAVDDVGAGPIWSAPGSYTTVSADDDGFRVGRADGTTGVVVRLDPRGNEIERREVIVERGEWLSGAHDVAGVLYVATVTSTLDGRLRRAAADGSSVILVDSGEPLRGFADAGGRAWTAAQGMLYAADASGAASVPTTFPATCVGETAGLLFACAQTRLVRLTADGFGDVLFDLADIEPPDFDLIESDARTLCRGQWEAYRDTLARIGVLDAGIGNRDMGTPLSDDGGGNGSGGADRVAPGCACAVQDTTVFRWDQVALTACVASMFCGRRRRHAARRR